MINQLKARSVIFWVLILEFGLVVLALITVRQSFVDVSTDYAEKGIKRHVQSVSNLLASEMGNLQQELRLIAILPQIQSGEASTCRQKLAEAAKVLGEKISNLSRTNQNAVIDCSTLGELIGADRSGQPHVQTIFQDPQHQPVVSSVMSSLVDQQPVIAVHIPILSAGGAFQGTAVAVVHLNRIANNFLAQVKFLESGHLVLLDANGDILFHPAASLIGKNLKTLKDNAMTNREKAQLQAILAQSAQQPSGSSNTNKNEDFIYAYNAVAVAPNNRWIIVSLAPKEELVDLLINLSFVEAGGTLLKTSFAVALALVVFSAIIAFGILCFLVNKILITRLFRLFPRG